MASKERLNEQYLYMLDAYLDLFIEEPSIKHARRIVLLTYYFIKRRSARVASDVDDFVNKLIAVILKV